MIIRFFLTIIILTLLELAVIIWIGQSLGVMYTLLLIVGTAVIGIYLAKFAGLHFMYKMKQQLASMQMPTQEVIDGLLILFGGFLFLLPGFITDIIALIFILPFTRPFARKCLIYFFKKRIRYQSITYYDRIERK